MTIDIVSREEWGARLPKRAHDLVIPTEELWLHHTAGSESGPVGMRQIQDQHMDDNGWWDIAYSFVIDPSDYTVYEGRGAGVVGGHTENHNSISHGIAVMGNFMVEQPDTKLLALIVALVRHGHGEGWWGNQLSGGHRDTKPTLCPGDNLQAVIGTINSELHRDGPAPVGDVTEDYVKRVQAAVGVEQDGIIGPVTTAAVERTAARESMLRAAIYRLADQLDELSTFGGQ